MPWAQTTTRKMTGARHHVRRGGGRGNRQMPPRPPPAATPVPSTARDSPRRRQCKLRLSQHRGARAQMLTRSLQSASALWNLS